jgi:uncharacterized protein (TIGR02246 family)
MPRIPFLPSLIALVLLLCWPATSMSGNRPVKDAESLATRFVDAWNAHDAAAFARLVATDSDWVTASGVRLVGREKIRAYLAEEHATWAKTTTMRAMNIHLRALSPKTAVVSFDWEISTPSNEGDAPSVARGNNLFVAVKEGDWIIVSGQVARKR